jgi:hypothetical protein
MYIDYRLKDQSPLKIILISAGAAYSIAQLQNFMTDPELCKYLTTLCENWGPHAIIVFLLLKLWLKEQRDISSHGFVWYLT